MTRPSAKTRAAARKKAEQQAEKEAQQTALQNCREAKELVRDMIKARALSDALPPHSAEELTRAYDTFLAFLQHASLREHEMRTFTATTSGAEGTVLQ